MLSLWLVVWWGLRPQPIIRPSASACSTRICGAQDRETAHESVIYRHEGPAVVKLSTVVRRTEHGHELPATKELVAILNDLVRPANEINVIFLEELLDHSLAKSVGNAAIVLSPARLTLFWVRPEQIAEKTILRHLGRSCYLLELGNGDKFRAEPAVHAQYFVIDERRDGHAIEDILELLPYTNGVASLALVVKSVDAIDLPALVITPQQEEVLLELDLVGEQQDDCLQTIFASIDIVTQE